MRHLYSDDHIRQCQFDFLYNYKQHILSNALMIGDLNTFLNSKEKRGGDRHVGAKIQSFRYFVNYMGILDLGFQSPKFT